MSGKTKGAHKDKRLTAAGVKAETRPGRYMDGNGLFLRVDKTGAKRWGQRIMVAGTRRDLGIGPFPAIGLAEARLAAHTNKEMARQGIDPLEAKRKAAARSEADQKAYDDIPTFSHMVDKVCKKKALELSNKKHAAQWRSTLETYASPIIGEKKVSEITVQDVLRTLEPVWERAPETASRLRGRIETVLNQATVLGYRTGDNPARWRGNLSELLVSVSKPVALSRLPTMDLRQVPYWWEQLKARDGMAARALEFVTLTAARSGEVRGVTWSEINLERKLWTIPAERMKNRSEHIVPLSDPAIQLLEGLPRLDGSSFIFFAPRGGQLSDMSLSAVMRRIHKTETAKMAEHVPNEPHGFVDPKTGRPAVPHGLRTCFRSWAAEQFLYSHELAELALAHRLGNAVSRAYNRADMLKKRRAMMQHWSDYLSGKVGLFDEYDEQSNVVPFRS